MCDQGDTGLAGYCHHITSNCRLCMYLSIGYLLIFPKTSCFILVALVWCVCGKRGVVGADIQIRMHVLKVGLLYQS